MHVKHIENNKCGVCGGALGEVLLEINCPDRFERYVGIDEKGYKRYWVQCSDCMAANNIHTKQNLKMIEKISDCYYDIDFSDSSLAAKFDKIMSLPEEESDNAMRVKRVKKFINNWFCEIGRDNKVYANILDIGSGLGVFLAKWIDETKSNEVNWEAVSIEPDPIAAKHLRELNLFDVKEQTFNKSAKLKNIDLVTLNKVLEHISEPVEFLKEVKSCLNEDHGIMYIEVPDNLTISLRPSNDNILGALHYHLYDIRSIAYLFELSGLQIIKVGRVFEPSGKISTYGFGCLPDTIKYLNSTHQ